MTPAEVSISMSAFDKKTEIEFKFKEREEENLITAAYMAAHWAFRWHTKKPPEPLDKILGKENKPKKKVMSDEQMFQQVKMLNALMGGE